MEEKTNHLINVYDSVKLDIFEDSGTQKEKSEVDGVHILARVAGPSFFPGTISGNDVYYSKECWENILSNKNFQKRLKDRKILGTIGHYEVIDDYSLGKGAASHIVSDMYINENGVGIAEYLILNTNTGRELNILLRSGVKLSVSTKCTGYFEPGTKNVIPESFDFERIDFVLNPGYTKATPLLLENRDELNPQNKGKENTMDINEQAKVIAESVFKSLSEKVDSKEKANAERMLAESLTKQSNELAESLKEQKEALSEAKANIEKLSEELKDYTEIGTSESIYEALAKFKEIEDEQVKSIKDLEESLKSEKEQTEQMSQKLKVYEDLGTAEDLKTIVESSSIIQEKYHTKCIKDLAKTYDISEEKVLKFSEKLSFEELDEWLKETCKPVETVEQTGRERLTTRQISSTKPSEIIESSNMQSVTKSLASRLCGYR